MRSPSAAAVITVLAACAAKPTYLGTEVPRPCTTRDAEGCLGWMMERDLLAAELAIYDDATLRDYVQRVVARLARASTLTAAPRIMIADHDETYATAGRRIIISRKTIEKLETEAELAGILAHELAHIEARHVLVTLFGRPESDRTVNRRDAEAIADERAVTLLERAGYNPSAMAAALAAVVVDDDDDDDGDHPPRLERIARVTALAAGRTGFDGRAELLAHIDRMVLGRDVRLGVRIADAWIIPALALALELELDPAADEVLAEDDILVIRRRGRATILAYAVGTPWARELVDALPNASVETSTSVGRITRGTTPAAPSSRATDPLEKLARSIRSTLPQPDPGTKVAFVERLHGTLVVELGGKSTTAGPTITTNSTAATSTVAAPRLHLRAATDAELAAAVPNRIAIEHAPRTGRLSRLGVCRGRLLERADRVVAAGEPIKCAAAPLHVELVDELAVARDRAWASGDSAAWPFQRRR